jgi:hypothetical protein
MNDRKYSIIQALQSWINKRPGLDPRDYIQSWDDKDGRAAYFKEARSITKDKRDAQALLSYCARRDSITADDIIAASRDAFSGRLTITEPAHGVFIIDYCVGQYWPTEYRRAAAAVLASAIWARLREDTREPLDGSGQTIGDAIRANAKRELGRTLAARWFN